MINNVTLVGNLAKDPEIRYSKQGKAITNMTIACERYNADADFIRVVVFDKQAESAANYLTKGKKVAIVGNIKTGSYDDKDGKRVFTTEVIAQQVKFLSPPDRDKNEPLTPNKVDVDEFATVDDDDESLPF